ncbi:hypothetical protein LCGC14_1651280, partial [marine sediment metagenome]
ELLHHLHSLGYVGGGNVKKDFSFDQSKEDPKDLIGFHNDFKKVLHLGEQNRIDDARALGERLLKQRPLSELYALLLKIAVKQRDYGNAIRYGEKTLEVLSGRFNVHQDLGIAYVHTRQNEAAAKQFELALEFMPKDETVFLAERTRVHNQLGVIRNRQNKFELAIVQFEETLKLDPKQPQMLNALAWILATCPDQALRDPSKALELARQACDLTQSKHPVYLNTLALAYAMLNNFSEAVKTSEKALALAQAKGDRRLAADLQKQLDHLKLKVPAAH